MRGSTIGAALSSSFLYRDLCLSPRIFLSTRRFRNLSLTTGATFIRPGKAAEERHKRASLTSAKMIMAPVIELDQFILGTYVASLFAIVLLYVLRRSSIHDADLIRSKKNRGVVVAQNDAVSRNLATEDDSGIDVIIAGAGVAGAALAHTLGKAGPRRVAMFALH